MNDDIEKELEILWEFMPKEHYYRIGKRLLSHGIKETQSKYWVKDLTTDYFKGLHLLKRYKNEVKK